MKNSDKKQLIQNATLKLITENGFHGTPVSMIAEEAGVGAGTIYRYFENKEAIINELYDNIQTKLHEATLSNIPVDVSVKDEFFLKWRNILLFFLNNPYEAKFIEQYSSSPFISKKAIEETNFRNRHLKILIDRGIQNKIIRKVDYDIITVYMWGTIRQLRYMHSSGTLEINNKFIEDIYNIFWKGICLK